jgi:hypothetical protein
MKHGTYCSYKTILLIIVLGEGVYSRGIRVRGHKHTIDQGISEHGFTASWISRDPQKIIALAFHQCRRYLREVDFSYWWWWRQVARRFLANPHS